MEITTTDQNKEKRMKRMRTVSEIYIKCTSIQIRGVPEEEKKKRTEKIFEEIIVEKFPNIGKETINKSRKNREYHIG